MGYSQDLVIAAVTIWVLGVFILIRPLGLISAIIIASIKVLIPLLYFSFFFSSASMMKDDQEYLSFSIQMFDQGWGPIRMLLHPNGLKEISLLVGSGHYLYYWWNLLAFSLFGKYYYSAVFLNVGVTFVSAILLRKLLIYSGFTKQYIWAFSIFFLLHWDLITWSSFVNLKDMLVLCLTISALLLICSLAKSFSLIQLLLLVLIFTLFSVLRYYIPVLLLAASGFWLCHEIKDSRRLWLLPFVLAALIVLQPWASKDLNEIEQVLPLYPALRFFLMPQFWTLDHNEGFLFISSVLHWLLFFPLLFGAYQLWFKSASLRLILIYSIVIIIFYALVPELQGYRHRVQICFVIALCQFQAMWVMLGLESLQPSIQTHNSVTLSCR